MSIQHSTYSEMCCRWFLVQVTLNDGNLHQTDISTRSVHVTLYHYHGDRSTVTNANIEPVKH